ncbi:peptide chain release factor H [Wohlfahrtiimonas larvae]|uniref:Peptide chain release factor H n=1 Tax=Wohlfahrtiimonas larvae TaxID=1157986 RepID=A0ABP9MX33_9GAMM|nr:peptide chain release factor H [Wohlfahrtiimonas larvae]
MQIVQLSSAQGPVECSIAIEKALNVFMKTLSAYNIHFELIESVKDRQGLKSALLHVDIEDDHALIQEWQGTHQWIWKSSVRPNHPRKNWFFGVEFFSSPKALSESEIVYKAISAQGPGGQHVNKTSSAIQATHLATGISVKVQTERSQHANKRLANLLIQQKLHQRMNETLDQAEKERRLVHHQLERGNAKKIFMGDQFKLTN